MANVTIENPVINSPFEEPKYYFRFDKSGITSEKVEGRRKSSYITPIPQPRKRTAQATLFDAVQEAVQENELINQIRQRVGLWRQRRYPHVTRTTRNLLEYWTNPRRDKRLFFCQIEALETAIYITEAAKREGDTFIEDGLLKAGEEANPGVFRIAFKMATGSGKTVVMAMLIAWQALNKFANPRDQRFTDAFLIITPGVTIRDRLRVLFPNDSRNYYKQRDILPPDDIERLNQAKIAITNFHAFQPKEIVEAASLTKAILAPDKDNSPFTETPAQVVRRVCRGLTNRRSIIVINDEAHHCYQHKVDGERDKLTGEERAEAERYRKQAGVWISGIQAIAEKIGIKAVYDLSATPFFLRGSGYKEGDLFPWVVSDFALIDAIESGIVKIPRVPVADDSMQGDEPKYRNLWVNVRDDLPKRKSKSGDFIMPKVLQGALESLYTSYKRYHDLWEDERRRLASGATVNAVTPPPVMIVVCSNTMVSKMIYDWISGYEREDTLADGSKRTMIIPGNLSLFRNETGEQWTPRPNTILVDSEQLESGEGMTDDFKAVAADEIGRFKAEYAIRHPGRDPEQITDEELLREVMNTVGKPGELGAGIKCVVSVSMLTEGWDVGTVTHILGVRAFSTQLICEQVIGRGLRRISYVPDESGMFEPEYAEVYGVPFSFIPTAGAHGAAKPNRAPTHVFAVPERAHLEIKFPNVIGYRYDYQDAKLHAEFSRDSTMTLTAADVPTLVENAPIIGESAIHDLGELEARRFKEVEFLLAKLILEKYFREEGDQGEPKLWYFPQLQRIIGEWIRMCLILKDGTFAQMLLLTEYAHTAADKIHRAIVAGTKSGQARQLKPILAHGNPTGSTADVDFDTTREVYAADLNRSHVNFVACHSAWEAKVAQSLEGMPEVIAYVKNDGLGFTIPYTFEGREHQYIPDFIVRLHVHDSVFNLIIEVTGAKDAAKDAKVDTTRSYWLPAINELGTYGHWEFLECRDPYNLQTDIRALLGKMQLLKEI